MTDQTTATASSTRAGSPSVNRFKQRLKERRKQMGKARSSDEDEPEEELGEGVRIIHKLFGRKVTLHPDNTIKKSGKRIPLNEAEALQVAAGAGLPVPHVHHVETTPDGKTHISMDYIQGETLFDLWKDLSAAQKKDIARQLRDILASMRSIPPPVAHIGSCAGGKISDTRALTNHKAPPCRSEEEFNAFLMSSLAEATPPAVRTAFARLLDTSPAHRVVFSHTDLAPRNIIVREGKIVGLIDWEDAGWYPEYWEYVKFFLRAGDGSDWRSYADDIFPQAYPDELVGYLALSRYQQP